MGIAVNIVQVVAGIGHEASGPSYSVPRLASALAGLGNDVSLHVLDWEQTPSVPGVGLRIYPLVPWPRNLGLSVTMPFGLHRAARHAAVVHNHGLWMAPNVLAPFATMGTAARVVVSPRGVFARAALGRSPARKRLMWSLGQGAAVRRASLLHATSDAEAEDIRRVGLKAPIAIIPNGVDLPTIDDLPSTREGPHRLLFLGRLHPIKNIDGLVRAWARVHRRFADWELELVGPEEGSYGETLRGLAAELGVSHRVRFVGPLYGAAKRAAYRSSDVYVLPTRTENFGMTVAEALASEVPCIVTQGAPWEGLVTEQCGWWIPHGDAALADALTSALSLSPASRQAMGARGRAWMQRDFSWDGIARKMELAYAWILGQASKPDWVHTD